jgi:hypothetical protein
MRRPPRPCKHQELDRLRSRCVIDSVSDCWIWPGCVHPKTGRALVKWDGRVRRGHRLAWRLAGKRLRKGLLLVAGCLENRCINPQHQRAVTRRTLADEVRRNGQLSTGFRHSVAVTRAARSRSSTKLTLRKARQIRKQLAQDVATRDVARQFAIHPSMARKIQRNESWREPSPFGSIAAGCHGQRQTRRAA